eukprot:2919857-Pyramimonas_sp.AAC.1
MDDTTRVICWNCVEEVEGTSQLAFSRGLSSGGNFDKRSYIDCGNKDVQDAAMHYFDVCFVNVVMLQPNCRTTGLPSYFIPASNMTLGMNAIKKTLYISNVVESCLASKRPSTVLLTRTTSGYLGGPDPAMDYIGQTQGHLQCEPGPMYYLLA